MSAQDDQLRVAAQVQLGVYRSAPLVFARGRGCELFDVDGRRYLDFAAGIAVVSVGHAHPKLAEAIGAQAATLMHVSNLFHSDRQIALAAELVRRTPFSRVFFTNSGTEANEAMLKLARRYHHERGDADRVELVAAHQSFHGRTYGSLSVTGQPKYHLGMGPLLPGVRFVPYDDLDALRAAVGKKTAAVILEPIQGEGGVLAARDEYLRGARAICDEAGALLLLDEIQTGYGRTGRFLAAEWSGLVPDACSLAKGIGGGFPLGAMLVTEKVAGGLPPGSHGTTYGGNPLACAAGLAVLRIFDEERLVERAVEMGARLRAGLERLAGDSTLPVVTEARGRGLLLGLRVAEGIDPAKIVAAARARGLLLTVAGADVLRLTPPLVVGAAEVDEALDLLETALREISISVRGAS